MPASTPKMARFMEGCLHNPSEMHGECLSKEVSREFSREDATKEKWITINGRHVQIDGDGNIIKGGTGMGIENVGDKKTRSAKSQSSDKYKERAINLKNAFEDMGLETKLSSSAISPSEYLYVKSPDYKENDNGDIINGKEYKFRISNHALPEKYESADYDVSADGKAEHANGEWHDAVEWLAKKVGLTPKGNAKKLISQKNEKVAEIESKEKALKEKWIAENKHELESSTALLKSISEGDFEIKSEGGDQVIRSGNFSASLDKHQRKRIRNKYDIDSEAPLKDVFEKYLEERNLELRRNVRADSANNVAETGGIVDDPAMQGRIDLAQPEGMPSKVLTELDIAYGMARGELSSPQVFKNITFFGIRITGTGGAYRSPKKIKLKSGKQRDIPGEFVYRDPDIYLNDEFLQRCNGLPVLLLHPDQSILNSEEFENRMIGTVFLPYINDEDKSVWAIAKIYDKEGIEFMVQSQISTSPGVLFDDSSGNESIKLADGSNLLIEGKPCLLDHVAVCEAGVWDKLGEPDGVRLDSQNKGKVMDEEEKKAAEAAEKAKKDASGDPEHINAIMDALGKISSRLDSMGTRMDAFETKKFDSEEDEEEKKTTEEAEAKKAKADSDHLELKKRLDAIEDATKTEDNETDYAAMADAQARADSTMHLFGQSAPRPARGEKVQAYRTRVLKSLQVHSKLKDVDFSKIADAAAFSNMENQVYNDAEAAAHNPATFAQSGGQPFLREIKKKRGRVECMEFIGDIEAFMGAFKQPTFSGRINKQDHK